VSIAEFPKCILVDANFLIEYVSPKTSNDDRERINHFLATTEKIKAKIIIPMPAFAEYLVGADTAAIDTSNMLERKAYVVLAPFDRAAAFECALIDRAAIGNGDKKDGLETPWQKIKIDRQNVAIGKAYGAKLVISADIGVRNNALRIGMLAKTIQDLELPAGAKQISLDLPAPKK
jgi:predicted nucleic acid-binding protein